MLSTLALTWLLLASGALTPQRVWLDRLALLVPGPSATRWLLIADVVCLVVIGLRGRRPVAGMLLALAAGFVTINGFGMAFTDFYLGLAAFHLTVGIATALFAGHARWLGAGLVALALVLGIAT
jgi:hypothetical protein